MSTEIEFKKIHAFATETAPGNPAGYVRTETELPADIMQKFAAELKGFVSEVVFVTPGDTGIDLNLRYFSCEREVPFCGHGTLATVNYIVSENPELNNRDIIRIKTSKGILGIENLYKKYQSVFIYAPPKTLLPSAVNNQELAAALNISEDSIDTAYPVKIYNAGLDTLIVPLSSAAAVTACTPDYQQLREFCFASNCSIAVIFSTDTTLTESSFRTRVFAPTFGYLEDPATGSGNSALAYYLEDHKLWDGSDFIIEQGTAVKHPNLVYIRKPAHNPTGVMFGGQSIVKMEGKYYL